MRHSPPLFFLPGMRRIFTLLITLSFTLSFILSLVLGLVLGITLGGATPSLAMEVAPRISDREIVERLTRLEEGQKFLMQDIDRRFAEQNRHIDQRFDGVNSRFAEQSRHIDQRFDDMNQRITELHQTMLTLFGSLIVLITALFGYIAWDRRTMFRPLKARQEQMEQKLEKLAEIVETRKDSFGDDRQQGQAKPGRPSRSGGHGTDAETPIVSGAARA